VAVPPFTATAVVVAGAATDNPQPVSVITLDGGTLQLPPTDSSGNVPLDFDTNSHGRRAVIDQNGNLTLDGAMVAGWPLAGVHRSDAQRRANA
jgi:hypothetical protein